MRRLLAALLTLLACAAPARAQQDTARPPGIRLITRYAPATRPALAIRPFAGANAPAEVLDSLTTIVRRDLEYADRFSLLQTPAALATGAVDYQQWNALRVMYVVTGELTPAAAGYELELVVHDVVYGKVRVSRRLRLPAETSPAFRLAAHAASDDVVRTITGRPGIAATRIAFTRQNPRAGGPTQTYDLLVVDSDGFGQRRLGGVAGLIFSPAWSPDGTRLLYTQNQGGWKLVERDVASGTVRTIDVGQANMITTPGYSPDGRRVAFAMWQTTAMELYEYNLAERCCLKRLTTVRGDDQSPTYSPDGSRIAFMATRLGLPHIYVMPANGGAQQRISPYVHGQNGYYTSPDWSPTGTEIAFHGHWNSRGTYQIMIADAARPGAQIRQLTSEGANEDPSWAPDGRHLVFTHAGVRGSSPGLYVVDTGTGTRRPLTTGTDAYRLADWSPVLLTAADLEVAGP
ncbi:MAG: hypothetical protein FIB01_13590 [Gemmatimonadetes bacterium]|nr:hypothetical protein [Gemmatimonadota bacterium]